MVDIGHGSAIFSTPQPSIAQLLKPKSKGANYYGVVVMGSHTMNASQTRFEGPWFGGQGHNLRRQNPETGCIARLWKVNYARRDKSSQNIEH
jgi:hypothetical protein